MYIAWQSPVSWLLMGLIFENILSPKTRSKSAGRMCSRWGVPCAKGVDFCANRLIKEVLSILSTIIAVHRTHVRYHSTREIDTKSVFATPQSAGSQDGTMTRTWEVWPLPTCQTHHIKHITPQFYTQVEFQQTLSLSFIFLLVLCRKKTAWDDSRTILSFTPPVMAKNRGGSHQKIRVDPSPPPSISTTMRFQTKSSRWDLGNI
jgi:hypothetical protein